MVKRQQQIEWHEEEKDLVDHALEEREKQDHQLEFQSMLKCQIALDATNNKPFGFEDFAENFKWLWRPFETIINDNVIKLLQDDAAIMIKTSKLYNLWQTSW
jgi:hypothetical protein